MNFDEINKIYEYISTSVYPHLKCRWSKTVTSELVVDKYLSIIDTDPNYQLLAVPYLFDPLLFLKKFVDNCIIYYNTTDPSDGLMLILHQMAPKLHVHSRLVAWVENDVVHSYLTSLVFHKNGEDAIKFMNDNSGLKKHGNTADRKSGGFKI